jgi:hypothetical protein
MTGRWIMAIIVIVIFFLAYIPYFEKQKQAYDITMLLLCKIGPSYA